jgi:tetratricopeptide (TPR) repeat protein
MGAKDKYSSPQVQRIIGVTEKQLDHWDSLGLVHAQKESGNRFYDFGDLISLRTIKQLVEKGVPANRIQRTVAALHQGLSKVHSPLSELRVASDGKDLFVERNGARLEPLSGQFLLNFETRELDESVRVVTPRGADDWLATALKCEAEGKARAEAIDAYNRALSADPQKLEALVNCGTLYYEDGNLDKASDYFRRALVLDPNNALAHFNLGSVLEEAGKLDAARGHLRQAVRLRPDYSDAHYNLAFVCEKLGSNAEAHEHWQAYVKLDPTSPWCLYARERIASFQKALSSARGA